MNEMEEALRTFLTGTAAQVLDIDPEEVLWEADVDEYGFASMEVNRFCVEVNRALAIDLVPVVFLEHTSLAALGAHLLERYPVQLERHLFATT